jgi:5-formyltetrahydrofolate cyclo-ligase
MGKELNTGMLPEVLKSWRKTERQRLIAGRLAVPPDELDAWRVRIDGFLERSFPGLANRRVAFCWPLKNEYDARHFVKTLRSRGALTALPVVVAAKQPLAFREWHPGVELAKGALDIPYPVNSAEVTPEAVLLPMNGWDGMGYRLGYGGGFFDRTLAGLAKKPVTIGVSYELARLDTIHPQPWDIPVDYVVTERGVYRRDPEGLAFLEAPEPSGSGTLASPVCYADEAYFSGQTRNNR